MEFFNINSVYLATEGEGIHIGHPQVFIRFQGCSIGCVNCDSMDTWQFDTNQINFSNLWQKIESETRDFKVKRFSITGGDPLHPKLLPQVEFLVDELKKRMPDCFINIEASGSRVVDSLFNKVDFISFDFKTPSTAVKTPLENVLKIVREYPSKYQIKSVIESEADINAALSAYLVVKKELQLNNLIWCLTPCYNTNEAFPEKRFQDVIFWNYQLGCHFRVIGQQHKWIYGANLKQV